MLVIIGYIIVLGSIIGAFVGGGGHAMALVQPIEFIIIGGSAFGAFLIANTPHVLKSVMKTLPTLLKRGRYHKKFYIELLSTLYLLMIKIKKQGLMTVETDIDHPNESEIFNAYPLVKKDKQVMDFLRDYLRLMVSGSADFFQMENLMDIDIQTHHHEGEVLVGALARLGDAMPAFGIVAAVMGIVHTMESLGIPPNELGKLVAQALVGTFLGVLLGYGFVSPLSHLLEHKVHASTKALECIKVALLAVINNYSPNISIEFARKVLFAKEKPSNAELEELLKQLKSKAQSSAG